jgi:hypothetical protein
MVGASTEIRHELFQSAHNSAQGFRPVPVSHGNALLEDDWEIGNTVNYGFPESPEVAFTFTRSVCCCF